MNQLLIYSFVILLFFVAYQDFKQRMVSLVLFIGLAVIAIYFRLQSEEFFLQISLTGLITALQIMLLFVMYRIKNKKWENIVNTYLGLGDILFLCILALFLPPFIFILFEVASCLIIILYVVSWSIIKKQNINSFTNIPFAGLLSVFLSGLILTNLFTWKINIQNDDFLLIKYVYGY